jgi:hypothetical protein|tara:strand:+ start:872 stop:1156 length:285 start_codon:yes stop_codon:yes gene_type:complete
MTMASPIIKVRYLGATNHRGSRSVASAWDGRKTISVTVNYDYCNGYSASEEIAAMKLSEKLTADNRYYVVTVGNKFYDDKASYFGTVFTNKTEA